MKVAVLGGSGFIGSRFCALYQNQFDELRVLSSKTAPLDSFEKLKSGTSDIDVLVHATFDHTYQTNIIGIHNIMNVCKVNNIKRLIYLSTVSVYDPESAGVLDEESKYSKLKDPYAKEKKRIEKEINNTNISDTEVIILQPTIVYGLGGAWSNYALHVAKAATVFLPNNGKSVCNAVFVDDVAYAIFQSTLPSAQSGKYLITGKNHVTWYEFYEAHTNVLRKLSLPTSFNVENISDQNDFHHNNIINMIFLLWFKTPVGSILDLAISTLKKIRSKKYASLSSDKELIEFLHSDVNESPLNLLGITRKVHDCKFVVTNDKALLGIQYKPEHTFNLGIQQIEKEIVDIML